MKPQGRIHNIKFPGKQDLAPNKNYSNWWEYEMNTDVERGSLKQHVRREIEKEIDVVNNWE